MSRRPGGWPPGVEPFAIEDFEKLGSNANNEFFYDGKRLVTRRQLYLTWPQALLAVLTGLAALATIATGVNSASIFLCARHVAWLTCPK